MMNALHGTSEIVMEESGSESKKDNNNVAKHCMLEPGQKYSIEDDINRLFETIDIRTSRDTLRRSAMKRPIRVSTSQASGIGISESLSLKQALRGLCISQASEMAAMKRLSKPSRFSGVSEAGTIKRLYSTVVVEANESGCPLNEENENLVKISLVPERSTSNFSEEIHQSKHVSQVEKLNQNAHSSTPLADASEQKAKMTETLAENETVPLPTVVGCDISKTEIFHNRKLKETHSSFSTQTIKRLPMHDEIVPALAETPLKIVGPDGKQKGKLHSASFSSSVNAFGKDIKSTSSSSRVIKPIFRNKTFVKKKVTQNSISATGSSNQCNGEIDNDLGCSTSTVIYQTSTCALENEGKEKQKTSATSSSTNFSVEVSSTAVDSCVSKPGLTSGSSNGTKSVVSKSDERSRSREKGEFSQSSKSSIGDYSSSTTSFSGESNLSGSSRSGYRPHMSKDLKWESIHGVQKQHRSLGLRHFKLLRKLGGGDIGTVYLAELIGTNCLFALKVMDNDFLASRRKIPRAQTERDILQMLDHPFLPTLYAHFTTERFSCLVMEYCPGGDLHVLRQKQPSKSFSEQAVRFYVAEVLLALEYLHMLGVVYRDLKPENILVREDGHIMLLDFDLSLRCTVNPTLVKSSSPDVESPKRVSSPCSESSCIDPFCLHPSWQVPCFTPRFLSAATKARKVKSDIAAQVTPLPQLVVEPTSARSNSFVGTHEYLAPEIIKGEGHGSSVDWWTFGIFLYELLYGKTPFKGSKNEDTLTNVVSQCLKFPAFPMVSSHARDLIRRLLQKEPDNRLGSVKGAGEIKQHPFFEGLNWALIRCAAPPELPKAGGFVNVTITPDTSLQNREGANGQKAFKRTGEDLEFEMF